MANVKRGNELGDAAGQQHRVTGTDLELTTVSLTVPGVGAASTSLQQQNALQQYVITGTLPVVQAASVTPVQQPQTQLYAQVQGVRHVTPQAQASFHMNTDGGVGSALTTESLVTASLVSTVASIQIQSPTKTNTLQRHLSTPGMIGISPLSPGRGSVVHHITSTVSTPSQASMQQSPGITSQLHLQHQQQDAARELQMQHQILLPTSGSSISASGGTIHHHGQSPSRGALPPLANPQQILGMNINLSANQTGFSPQQQAQVQQRRLSGSLGSGVGRNLMDSRTSPVAAVVGGSSTGAFLMQSPTRVSPAQSPDRPRKRIKLEEVPPATSQAASYRKLILDHKHREMLEIKETYHEHLTELFFLQNGGNIMDYFQWKKRPTVQLVQFLKSGNLDSDDDEEVHGHEKKINDEVKIITSGGSNTPLATPVAISTTLPAAVASLQQQQQGDHSRKLGGRHGMIFGHLHSSPSAALSQQTPGPVTVTTQATSSGITTVHQTPQTITITATLPYPSPLTTTSIATPTTTTKSTKTVMTASTTPTISSERYTAAVKSPVVIKKEQVSVVSSTPSDSSLTITQLIRQSSASVTSPVSVNTSLSTTTTPKAPKSPVSPSRQQTRQHSISAVYDHTLGSQEAIVERAKQEAQVMQRIADLRKEGLWSSRRLPKVQEPPRNKAHWDYLLEEMQWLAADFAQERKWKKAAARKIARMITRYFQEQQQKEQRAEKEEGLRLKRIASNIAKQIKEFWANIEKVVEYKQQSRLEEKRKKALDVHLNFIVDQTEKYSSWLSEGLAASHANSTVSSCGESKNTSPSHSIAGDDHDFEPEREESDDDEETIEKEEETYGIDEESEKAEVEALKKESEVPIEDLLKSLPPEVLNEEMPPDQPSEKNDDEFSYCSDDEEAKDEEETLEEQEKHEKKTDHKEEMDDLVEEGNMTVEELMAKYAGAYESDFEMPESESEITTEEEDEEEEESEEAESEEETDAGTEDEGEVENVGMEYLINPETSPELQSEPRQVEQDGKAPKKEITDIAAAAMSIQPTGYTLETTQVKTEIPFLLKHTLREYQHVGMEWLATMHERKLNGILADEMGLGKTIQTIALLANLSCEHGVWGPHLIVVPTSVMLNWEMELKKWCPAFKILTYYGSQKERKNKRQGWTKTNAFHICITSYKLVIQDHQSFRRKKWKYLILDEAQNIKNFKSQRWQTLLNFTSQRRLLLTGTPLQNNLMELWSLMHFLMPHVFQSHREFKEWFSNPLSGMIEGSHEYNENLIKRLHKVLRPFLLRRLKIDVEKQMPQKYEHVVMCRLSKRQRFLYDDFMSQTRTKETLTSGHFMSVINILMQLRKVCNHPNLFDPRPIVSPFQMEGITFTTASLVTRVLDYDPLKNVDFFSLYSCLGDMELKLPAFAAHRIKKLQTPRRLIMEIDTQPDPAPRLKPLIKPKPLVFRSMSPMNQVCKVSGRASPFAPIQPLASPISVRSPVMRTTSLTPTIQGRASPASHGIAYSSVASPGSVSLLTTQADRQSPVPAKPGLVQRVASPVTSTAVSATPSSGGSHVLTSQPITVQIHHTQQGTRLMIPSGQLSNLPDEQSCFIHIVQTSTGQQIITSTQPPQQSAAHIQTVHPVQASQTAVNGPAVSTSSPRTVISTPGTTVTPSLLAPKQAAAIHLPSSNNNMAANSKPVVRVPPMSPVSSALTSVASVSSASTESGSSTFISKSQLIQHVVRQVTADSKQMVTGTASKSVAATTVVSAASQATTTTRVTRQTAGAEKKMKENSPLHLKELEEKRAQRRKHKLERIANLNRRRCEVKPVYGQDLCHAVDIFCDSYYKTNSVSKPAETCWQGQGFLHCYNVHNVSRPNHPNYYWKSTDALSRIVHTPDQYIEELSDVIDRFVFVTPPVCAPSIKMHTSHPSPSTAHVEKVRDFMLHQELSPRLASLHKICSNMHVQFPELRLIQYDCGKLQTMDRLLRQLKTGSHRVLIFTQMTKMLDVLEAFLNYHGHRYLRLDGTTHVEQRQALMERFNMDRRIFCFILSTRSGGIGVNLTGADTVIFYDSDWNPTMDAQAQDRCHRIGQTRDVHIYRLISEKTIEENILKKANQKRLLGDVAIEGGNFTTAFFKQNTIKELFDEPSGLDALVKEKAAREAAKQIQQRQAEQTESSLTVEQMEQALCNAEDETDVQAAKVVHAEQKAELAEFDEEIPWDERESEQRDKQEEDMSRVEMELAMLDKELTPVERYAVAYMEKQMEPLSDELEKAEEEISVAKEEWELGRLKELKEEEERRAEIEEDEVLFTYSRDDAYNQIYICDENSEIMPIWAPPTPPQDDNDMYIDETLCFLYEPSIMPESQLPPVFVKKEHKRVRVDPNSGRKQKVRKDDQIRVPRSLFDRPTAALLKMRREAKLQRIKQGFIKPQIKASLPAISSSSSSKPVLESASDLPEWLIHEDWALLQAVQFLQELPLNLMIVNPAHIPNWDMVSDIVNVSSRVYRSSKQCKNRYETVIVPREEGKILYDINPRKQKKSKGIYKTKNNRPMRTSQLYIQDNYGSLTLLHNMRFDSVKAASGKRTPTLRSTLANPTHKNPKHAAVLLESGINYDQPSTPIQVATIRAERIAREKKVVNAAAAAEQLQAQQRVQQAAQAQGTATSAQPATTLVQAQQLQPVVTVANTATLPATIQKASVGTGITAVSLARTLGASIVVNTPAGVVPASPFATINKRVASLAQTTSSTLTGTLTQAVRARPGSTMTVQDLSAVIAGQAQARAIPQTTASTTILTTGTLSSNQVGTAQRVGSVTAVTAVASGTTTVQQQLSKNLTSQQLQLIRQQAMLKQKNRITQSQAEQLRKLQAAQQQVAAQGITVAGLQKTLAVTTPLSITQTAVTQPSRLQVSVAKQPGVKPMTRPATEAEMALLLQRQRQQQQQQQQLKGSGQTTTQTVHQIQLTPQLLAQAQLQGQTGSQPVATLVKTVAPSVTIPSVTIPVSVGGVNINVSVPQQKATTVAKATAVTPQQQQQLRQLQLQQLQQRKVTAAQLQQQKVTTLTAAQIQQVAAGKAQLQTPLIIQQQQQKQLPTTMTVQQIQQIVQQQKAQAQAHAQAQSNRTQAQTIQQIITSVSPPSTTATIIASQLFSQSQATSGIQTVSKLSLPASTVTALVTQARTVTPVAASSGSSITVSAITTTPTVTVTTIPAMSSSPSTLTIGAGKSLEQVVVSPTKMQTSSAAVVQQVKTFQAAQVRQVPAQIQGTAQVTQVQVQATPHLQLQTTPTGVTQVHLAPQQVQVHKPATIAQTISQVQQQQQQSVTPVAVTQVQQSQQQATTTQQQQAQQQQQTLQVTQQQVQQIQVQEQQAGQTQSKPSPYTMRLRNSRN